MKVLIVSSTNTGQVAPFVADQVNALEQLGVEIHYFHIYKKGIWGYLSLRAALLKKIDEIKPDLIHAHYGLSGLFSNLQSRVPVVTTYHGCDINRTALRWLSHLSIVRSSHNIFVSTELSKKIKSYPSKASVIPCGINFDQFFPIDKMEAREQLGFSESETLILFSSDFARPEKNARLAFEAIERLPGAKLLEYKGYSRKEANLLMNACDAGLLTSLREGSPMFPKEMLACRKPIVCTDVGDIHEYLNTIEGCRIVAFDSKAVSEALEYALRFQQIELDADTMARFDNRSLSAQIYEIYQKILGVR